MRSVLREVAEAATEADLQACRTSEQYASDPALAGFAVPRVVLRGAELELRFAVASAGPAAPPDSTPVTDAARRTAATRIASAAGRRVVDAVSKLEGGAAESSAAGELRDLLLDAGHVSQLAERLRQALEGHPPVGMIGPKLESVMQVLDDAIFSRLAVVHQVRAALAGLGSDLRARIGAAERTDDPPHRRLLDRARQQTTDDVRGELEGLQQQQQGASAASEDASELLDLDVEVDADALRELGAGVVSTLRLRLDVGSQPPGDGDG